MGRHDESGLISAYVDGELAGAERGRFEAHLESCAECRRETEATRAVKAAVKRLPRRPMPASLPELVAERLPAPRVPWWRAWAGEPALWVPVGALAAAALWAFLATPGPADAEAVPLEVLEASHARCAAEAIVPTGDLVAAEFSSRLQARLEAPHGRR